MGGTVGAAATRVVEAFDPAQRSLTAIGSMLTGRTGFSATPMPDGTVLIAGGKNSAGATLSSVEVFDAVGGSSVAVGEMLSARHHHSAVLLPNNNQILFAGGADGDTVLGSAELFTPWTGTFSRTASLATARQGAAMMAVRSGLAQISGGSNVTGPVAGSEAYGYATIGTNKPGYAKGETVSVSGDGWAAGSPVKLTFMAPRDPEHRTSPFVTSTTADNNGHISYSGFQSDLMQGQAFTVTAEDGLSQGQTYVDPFDAPANTSITETSITPLNPIVGQAFSVLFKVNNTTAPAVQVVGGTVTFTLDSLAPVTVNLGPDGTATYLQNPGTLIAGFHNLVAKYNGSIGTFNASANANFSFTINQAPTLLTLAGNANVPYGTNVTVGATIAIPPPGSLVGAALGGTIHFLLDGVAVPGASCPDVTVVAGNLGPYSCTLVAVPVGAHTMGATLTANGDYGNSTAALTGGVVISKLTLPSFDLQITAQNRVFSQTGSCPGTCNFVAQVVGISNTVLATNTTGTMDFFIDGNSFVGSSIGVANLGNPFTVPDQAATAAGNHTITVNFSGNANINPISNSVTQIISQAPTSTVLTANPPGPGYDVGTPITFTATVTSVAPAAVGPVVSAGSVAFYVDGSSTAALTLNLNAAGTVAFTTIGLSTAGSPHSVRAVYSGSANYATSTAAALQANVGLLSTTTSVGSSPNPSNFGTPVTFTVTVARQSQFSTNVVERLNALHPLDSGPVPTGTVLLKINGGVPGFTGTLSQSGLNGVTMITVPSSALPVGALTVTATYSGDANFAGSTGSLTQNVATNTISTTTTITPPATNLLVYGQQVQLPVVVTSNAPSILTPPLGNITYNDTLTTLPGVYSFSDTINSLYITNLLAVGTHNITASYTPPNPQTGNTFLGSTSAVVALSVAKAATTITFTVPQNGTFNAIVTVNAPGGGAPTGTVKFQVQTTSSGLQAFGYASLLPDQNYTGGQRQYLATWVGPPVNGAVTAVYGGDTNFLGSISLPVNVESQQQLYPSGVTVTSSTDPATIGQSITYTAAVRGARGIATGTVQFFDNGVAMGSSTIDPLGNATYTVASLTAGSHNITAVFGGDVNYQPATSAAYGQQINKLVSSLTVALVTANAQPLLVGQTASFTLTFGPAAPAGYNAQTGTVTISENGVILGSATVVYPSTTIKVGNLLSGTHIITSQYSGDGTWYGITSAGIAVTVGRAATTTTLTSAPAPATSQIMLTAKVVSAGGVPTGTVNFVDGSNQSVVATATLAGGIATALVRPGGPSVVASYLGDGNFTPSNSGGFNEIKALSAASGTDGSLTANQIVSLFGSALATSTASGTPPLNTTLGGTTVGVSDSTGNLYPAKLYYASPTQVNFVMPALLAPGPGVISLSTGAGANFTININIAASAPGLFSANGSGSGQAAALLYDGPPTGVPTITSTVDTPIALTSTDKFYLELFGTGISNATLAQISATVNGVNVPILNSLPQSQFPGLDQVNIGPLPLSLQGKGTVNVVLTVNGTAANTVTVNFQ
jgi:large repetitive protein